MRPYPKPRAFVVKANPDEDDDPRKGTELWSVLGMARRYDRRIDGDSPREDRYEQFVIARFAFRADAVAFARWKRARLSARRALSSSP